MTILKEIIKVLDRHNIYVVGSYGIPLDILSDCDLPDVDFKLLDSELISVFMEYFH